MRRTGIRRKPRAVDPSTFDLVTKAGDRYPWPAKWMSEADWQENVIDYALHGDQQTEWFHCRAPQTSRAGFFDLTILQPNRGVAILPELKVRDRHGKANQVSAAQKRFIAAAIACRLDVRVWLWPDDQREAWETLTGRSWDECPK